MDRSYSSLSELLAQEQTDAALLGSSAAALAPPLAQPKQRWSSEPSSRAARAQQRLQVEAEWWAAIAALTHLLHIHLAPTSSEAADLASWDGVVLSGPLPVLWDRALGQRLSTWVVIPQPLEGLLAVTRPLLPDDGQTSGRQADPLQMIPLPAGDELSRERFCLVLTTAFSLSLVLSSQPDGTLQFQFSFEPSTNQQVWQQLRSRVAQIRPPLLATFDQVCARFIPQPPDYRVVAQFTRYLLSQLRQQQPASGGASTNPADSIQLLTLETPLPEATDSLWPRATPLGLLGAAESPAAGSAPEPPPKADSTLDHDAELLKAMAHEIRTPLTTIRTFTRSLLKRLDLPAEAIKRLQQIDRECTQQIDRFNLIFRAVELETSGQSQPQSPLSAISLNQIFQDSIPLWQQQAQRRNLTLEVKVPAHMPKVASDPTMLNQVLTGLIDRFTHSLPPYSHITLIVSLAGHQLKLQFQSLPQADAATPGSTCQRATSPFRSVGQLLMFQPETGGISLNLNATKNLFQALGGKLTVRQKPQRGEVLTVYLPLETHTL